ncbi:hypothetical protein C8F04DRAFT_1186890 [Mycena alexandri]|uniref:Uncharacterized protein n=1 Tax=Mycena alexandri TaxID=1745969 RepID=A0AAD6SLQ5_9AGAR|nr:hypothetical protein C8F04DRAFT_1186890 [Mycena alexandri]
MVLSRIVTMHARTHPARVHSTPAVAVNPPDSVSLGIPDHCRTSPRGPSTMQARPRPRPEIDHRERTRPSPAHPLGNVSAAPSAYQHCTYSISRNARTRTGTTYSLRAAPHSLSPPAPHLAPHLAPRFAPGFTPPRVWSCRHTSTRQKNAMEKKRRRVYAHITAPAHQSTSLSHLRARPHPHRPRHSPLYTHREPLLSTPYVSGAVDLPHVRPSPRTRDSPKQHVGLDACRTWPTSSPLRASYSHTARSPPASPSAPSPLRPQSLVLAGGAAAEAGGDGCAGQGRVRMGKGGVVSVRPTRIVIHRGALSGARRHVLQVQRSALIVYGNRARVPSDIVLRWCGTHEHKIREPVTKSQWGTRGGVHLHQRDRGVERIGELKQSWDNGSMNNRGRTQANSAPRRAWRKQVTAQGIIRRPRHECVEKLPSDNYREHKRSRAEHQDGREGDTQLRDPTDSALELQRVGGQDSAKPTENPRICLLWRLQFLAAHDPALNCSFTVRFKLIRIQVQSRPELTETCTDSSGRPRAQTAFVRRGSNRTAKGLEKGALFGLEADSANGQTKPLSSSSHIFPVLT